MSRIFLPVYRFFHNHKALMYIAMGLSFVVFLCFGLKVQYEEDIFSLMPQQSVESQLAFSSIGLKDKVYLQMAPTDGKMEPEELGELMDELEERLLADDSATGYIDNILAHIDAETGLAALDFVLEHLPTFVDTAAYAAIDSALRPEAALAQMEKNQELLLADETGGATQMVAADPLGLRRVIAGDLMAGATAGRTLVGGHFFCPDSSVALAWLAPAFASSDSKTAHRFAKQLAKTTAAFEAEHPEVHILAHGAPLASVANASRIKADLVLTVGVSLVLILILIGFFFRSAGFLLKQLLPIGYGMVFALACIWWIQGSMSLMALGISAIVLGVALSYCLHVTIHHFSTGDPEKMLLDEATPVTLGCITTVGAFCSLLFTDSSLLRDFGLFASLALVGTTFFALVFLPHFMPKRRVETDSRQFRRVLRLNNMPFDRKRWFLILMAAIVVVGVAFAHRVGFDSDLRHLNYKDAQHGIQGGTITVNVDGPVKFTLGGCAYGNNIAVQKNSEAYTTIDNKVGCDNSGVGNGYTKFVTWTYNVEEAAVLTFTVNGYLPYFFAEACDFVPQVEVRYYDTDGKTLIGSEIVNGGSKLAYKYNADSVTVAAGKAFRGWFDGTTLTSLKVAEGIELYEDLNLFAKATDIEVAQLGAIFNYDLTQKSFYIEDHELLSTEGGVFHDSKHGWVFSNGNTLSVQVAGNALLIVGVCEESATGTTEVKDADGNVVGSLQVEKKVTGDGSKQDLY